MYTNIDAPASVEHFLAFADFHFKAMANVLLQIFATLHCTNTETVVIRKKDGESLARTLGTKAAVRLFGAGGFYARVGDPAFTPRKSAHRARKFKAEAY